MNVLLRPGEAGGGPNLPSSMSLYRLSVDSVVEIEAVSSCLKVWIKGVFLPQNSRLGVDSLTSDQVENLSHVCPPSPNCSSLQI